MAIEQYEKQITETIDAARLRCNKCGGSCEYDDRAGWVEIGTFHGARCEEVDRAMHDILRTVGAAVAPMVEHALAARAHQNGPHIHQQELMHLCEACGALLDEFLAKAPKPAGAGQAAPPPTQPPAVS